MTRYRSSTYEFGGYLWQYCFDSEDHRFYVELYTLEGHRVKKCEKADTQEDAKKLAWDYLKERGGN